MRRKHNNSKMKAGAIFPAMVIALLTACAQGPVPEDHFYRLEVQLPAARPRLFSGTMEIARFSADRLTAGGPISYREAGSAHELRTYHYHSWVQAPTLMLRDELKRFLAAAGAADHITTPQMRSDADYEVFGQIRQFEQIKGSPSKAAVELELILKEVSSGKILVQQTYVVERAAPADTIGASVEAFNAGVTEIFKHFLDDITANRESANVSSLSPNTGIGVPVKAILAPGQDTR